MADTRQTNKTRISKSLAEKKDITSTIAVTGIEADVFTTPPQKEGEMGRTTKIALHATTGGHKCTPSLMFV